MSIQFKVDDRAVMDALDQLDKKGNRQTLQKAVGESAKYLKPKVQAESRPVSKRMGRGVSAVKARRGTPASIVKYTKLAWFAHFVIGGTRDHSTKKRGGQSTIQTWTEGGVQVFGPAHDVRGVKANPIIERVADREGDHSLEIAETSIVKTLGLDT